MDETETRAAADLCSVLQDWQTIWQSELAGAAVDPELTDSSAALMKFWTDAGGALTTWLRAAGGDERGPSGSAATPWTAAIAAAFGTRDAEIARLARSVAELERKLATLEPGGREPGGLEPGNR